MRAHRGDTEMNGCKNCGMTEYLCSKTMGGCCDMCDHYGDLGLDDQEVEDDELQFGCGALLFS